MRKDRLQTSAIQLEGSEDARSQDQKDYEAGHGGSYSMDPVTREVTLVERTAPGIVSRKEEGVTKPQPDPADAGATQVGEQPATGQADA